MKSVVRRAGLVLLALGSVVLVPGVAGANATPPAPQPPAGFEVMGQVSEPANYDPPVMTAEQLQQAVATASSTSSSTAQSVGARVDGVQVTDIIEPDTYVPVDTVENYITYFDNGSCEWSFEYGAAFGAAVSWIELDASYCNTTPVGIGVPQGDGEGLSDNQVVADQGGNLVAGNWASATSFHTEYQSTVDLASLVGATVNICLEGQPGNLGTIGCFSFQFSWM